MNCMICFPYENIGVISEKKIETPLIPQLEMSGD